MTIIDWIAVVILGSSVLFGAFSGFVRSCLSIVGWVLGIVLAYRHAAVVGTWLPVPSWLQTALGAVAVIFAVVLACALVGALLRRMLSAANVGFVDWVFGMLFGLARGALVFSLLVYLVALTPAKNADVWQRSVSVTLAQTAIHMVGSVAGKF